MRMYLLPERLFSSHPIEKIPLGLTTENIPIASFQKGGSLLGEKSKKKVNHISTSLFPKI